MSKKMLESHMVRAIAPCPTCRTLGRRHSIGVRTIVTLKGKLKVHFGKFYCPRCHVHFNDARVNGYAPKHNRYGWDVLNEVYRLYEGNLKYREIQEHFLKLGIYMPTATAHDIVKTRGV